MKTTTNRKKTFNKNVQNNTERHIMASMKQTDQSKLKRGFNTHTVFESNTTAKQKTQESRKHTLLVMVVGSWVLGSRFLFCLVLRSNWFI